MMVEDDTDDKSCGNQMFVKQMSEYDEDDGSDDDDVIMMMINNDDCDDKSCVDQMFVKQTRAPVSHQVEKSNHQRSNA